MRSWCWAWDAILNHFHAIAPGGKEVEEIALQQRSARRAGKLSDAGAIVDDRPKCLCRQANSPHPGSWTGSARRLMIRAAIAAGS
jgi:hypothetical protein